MAIEVTTPRSRRAILAAALGAGAATVAAAVGRPLGVKAVDGEAVLVGGAYSSTLVTEIDAGTGTTAAIRGTADDGSGLHGQSNSGAGVNGTSQSGIGVIGFSTAPAQPAIAGVSSASSTGVQGFSYLSSGAVPPTPANTGVYGYAAEDASARGVTGETTAGQGVSGIATTGRGVNGATASGVGVFASATTGYGSFSTTSTGIGARGHSATGTGGYFDTNGPKIGTALMVVGRARFMNCVGVATIRKGTSRVTVTPGLDLVSTSAVVATLMGSAGGTTAVRYVAVNATTDTFTIYLTAKATAAVTVAWHVFG